MFAGDHRTPLRSLLWPVGVGVLRMFVVRGGLLVWLPDVILI